jgi:hypothetical protein
MLPPREVSDRNNAPSKVAPIFAKDRLERPKTPNVNAKDDEDLYDATPRVSQAQVTELSTDAAETESLFGPRKTIVHDEPEDELDALLAEQDVEATDTGKGPDIYRQGNAIEAPRPDFDDEMEVMAEMGDMFDY